ncbi:hypothetical protein LCGC14_1208500 [marine sediment metagenome]|uniref:Methyltransferase small domain-containing protein n=1 Tax=marine sediment metagenome TaxID=412755 RepID=A0A0F9LJ46_9ZZZZ
MIIQSGNKRKLLDFYPTPIELCRTFLLEVLPDYKVDGRESFVLDPGAGTGVWGDALVEIDDNVNITGIEIDSKLFCNPNYNRWIVNDFISPDNYHLLHKYDLVIGNPPFYVARQFIEKSYGLLRDGGVMSFLLRLSFLESITRYNRFWPFYTPKYIYVSTRRVSFTGNKKSNSTAYMLPVWIKGFKGEPTLRWFHWDYE